MITSKDIPDLENLVKHMLYIVSPGIKSLGADSDRMKIEKETLPDIIISAIFSIANRELQCDLEFQSTHDPIDLNIYLVPSDIGKETVLWKGSLSNSQYFQVNKTIQHDETKVKILIGTMKEDCHCHSIRELFDTTNTKITAVCHSVAIAEERGQQKESDNYRSNVIDLNKYKGYSKKAFKSVQENNFLGMPLAASSSQGFLQERNSSFGDKTEITEFEIEGINYIAYEKFEADNIKYLVCGDVQKEGRIYLKVSERIEATHILIKDNLFELRRVDKNGTIMEIVGYSLADALDFLID